MSPHRRRGRRPCRALIVGITAVFGLLSGAGVAAAHVTVDPATAIAGSYPILTFHVPNESAKASTVEVAVTFPLDHPFASVSLRKEPGWTAVATTTHLSTPISDDDNANITEAVSSITWTADTSGQIALGQFAEFEVSVGPVPKVSALTFRATQTYDDGTVVKWDEPTPASGVEPKNPAPVLTVAPSTVTAVASAAVAQPMVTITASPSPAAVGGSQVGGGQDGPARVLGVVGIIVGALGLLTGAVALRSRTRARP